MTSSALYCLPVEIELMPFCNSLSNSALVKLPKAVGLLVGKRSSNGMPFCKTIWLYSICIAEDGVIPSWFKMFSAFSLRFVSILAYTAFVFVIVLPSFMRLFYKIVASIRKHMKAKV